jgi:hypothetical protein
VIALDLAEKRGTIAEDLQRQLNGKAGKK